MKIHFNWKKIAYAVTDILLMVYLGMAMTSFNRPDESSKVCTQVNVVVADENTNGFLSAQEIRRILQRKGLYPAGRHMTDINPRTIEEALMKSSFVRTAECFKTQDGHVSISITQRLPVVRIKNEAGDDYYVDEAGGIMPNSNYVSDLIIATGSISRNFACDYLTHLAAAIMDNDFWKNQIVQINILPDKSVELVPRVGDHVIFIGNLPMEKDAEARPGLIADYLGKKLNRLEKFYKYGLSQAGWNKYHYISLEFENQIICKKNLTEAKPKPAPQPVEATPEANAANGDNPQATQQEEPKKPENETPAQAAEG